MMFKKLLKWQELKSISKKFALRYPVMWDVGIYGSFVRGKENIRDIDFAILLSQRVSSGEKLSVAQEFKEQIEKIIFWKQVHVQAVDIDDFLDADFLARQGILAESYLVLKDKFLADVLGFRTFVFIFYSLSGLTYSQKKMLYYALQGRRGEEGVLAEINGELIGKCILKIPLSAYSKIEDLLGLHGITFTSEFVMGYKKR